MARTALVNRSAFVADPASDAMAFAVVPLLSQFALTQEQRLKEAGIAISMDGKGRRCDNVFAERFWESIKYEHVYLHAYESVQKARTKIGRYIDFLNTTRPHSSLNALTPDQVYFDRSTESLAA